MVLICIFLLAVALSIFAYICVCCLCSWQKRLFRYSPNFLIDVIYFIFRERKGGRKRRRETSMCGCLSHTPYWGHGLQLRHVPWLGIKPATLWFAGWHSIHRPTPARASSSHFLMDCLFLLLSRMSTLYILEISYLSVVLLQMYFSFGGCPSVMFYFILLYFILLFFYCEEVI